MTTRVSWSGWLGVFTICAAIAACGEGSTTTNTVEGDGGAGTGGSASGGAGTGGSGTDGASSSAICEEYWGNAVARRRRRRRDGRGADPGGLPRTGAGR